MLSGLSFVVVILFLFGTSAAKLPPVKCEFNAQFDNCFKNYLGRTIPLLATQGIPEAKIPTLDPFKAPSLRLKFGSALAKGSIDLKNIVLEGLAETKIVKFLTNVGKASQDKRELVLEVHTFHPYLVLEGRFEKSSLVAMGYRLASEGTYKVTLRSVKIRIFATGALVKGKNVTSYQPVLQSLTVEKPDVELFHLEASDLIMNDPQLSRSVIGMANSLWEIFYDEVYPIIKTTVEMIGKQFINSYLEKEVEVPINYVEGK